MFAKHLVFIALVLAIAGQSAMAATITVSKDGTGDFTQIQPALDAAESGDTVMIGPGEYTDLIPSYIPGYAWDVDVIAYVRVPNLTIIGAGAGQTVLGPMTPQNSGQTFSPKCLVWLEGDERKVSGITFRNCNDGIHVTNGPIYVADCEFVDNRIGIIWQTNATGGWVRNSQFSSNLIGSDGLFMLGTGANISVSNCVFEGSKNYIQSIQGISFVDCEMKNARIGLQLTGGAVGTVRNCQIHDFEVAGIILSSVGPHCDIYDSSISGGQAAVGAYASATLTATGSIFEGGSDSVFYFSNAGGAVVNDCHLFRNGTYSINCNQAVGLPLVVHDFTMNYWGSTDPGVIAGWIKDQNDDPANLSIVNFLPLADGPVSVETRTWGGVKALFR